MEIRHTIQTTKDWRLRFIRSQGVNRSTSPSAVRTKSQLFPPTPTHTQKRFPPRVLVSPVNAPPKLFAGQIPTHSQRHGKATMAARAQKITVEFLGALLSLHTSLVHWWPYTDGRGRPPPLPASYSSIRKIVRQDAFVRTRVRTSGHVLNSPAGKTGRVQSITRNTLCRALWEENRVLLFLFQ
jgi:hypothetical protein